MIKDTIWILFFMICSQALLAQQIKAIKVKSESLYPFKQNVGEEIKYGYINRQGKVVVAPFLDFADDFYDGRGLIKLGEKYGFVNGRGRYIIMPEYEFAESFSEGLAYVEKGEKAGFIDKNGSFRIYVNKKTIAHSEVSLFEFNNGIARIDTFSAKMDKDSLIILASTWGTYYINKQGKRIDNTQGEILYNTDDQIVKQELKGGETVFLDKNLDTLFKSQHRFWWGFKDNLIVYQDRESDKAGYYDANGEVVIPAKFDYAYDFSEGLAVVSIRHRKYGTAFDIPLSKNGLINRRGNFVIPADYDHISGFHNGLSLFLKQEFLPDTTIKDEYIYMDRNFEKVFTFTLIYPMPSYYKPPKTDDVFNFNEE